MTEYLTDKEKRILLSAISRERKVCEEVDKRKVPYEISLVDVCKSLERKFMYDRLFKMIRADTIDEALRMLNNCRFGSRGGLIHWADVLKCFGMEAEE